MACKLSGNLLTWALDPVQMVEAAGIIPDAWQIEALRSQAKRGLMLCTRQGGKSTVFAGKAVHRAGLHPKRLVLLLAPSERQALELGRKIRELLNALPGFPDPVKDNEHELEWKNGSRIIALPAVEKTVRGFSKVDLLGVDEAARVPDALVASVRPMLAVSHGDLWELSTPFGKRGHFYKAWEGEAQRVAAGLPPLWARWKVTWQQCPRITAETVEAEREAFGDWWVEQEFDCEFRDTIDQVFSYEAVMAAMNGGAVPLDTTLPESLIDERVAAL